MTQNWKSLEMKSMDVSNPRQRSTSVVGSDELLVSTDFNIDEAKRFITYIKNFKKESELDQIFIRIPGNWRSDNASRKLLFEYLKDSHDYVIIETSPVLRAYFKTELTIRQSDPKKILKERR
ncbi:MAG: hypothetical protein ACFFCM_10535 [Promethearchaeota archaeon]